MGRWRKDQLPDNNYHSYNCKKIPEIVHFTPHFVFLKMSYSSLYKISHYISHYIIPTQDKVLVCNGPHDNGIQVTNDGATILKSIGVDNPAAKVLVGEWSWYGSTGKSLN